MSDRTLTLLLVRHGETLWNAEGRWQGQTDVPLSDIGREQARRLGTRLGRLWVRGALPTPALAFSSDLSRATETAALLLESAGRTLPIETTPDLRERSFGSWEGKTALETGSAPGSGERASNAEDYTSVWLRMNRVLESAWERNAPTVLIVGHGGSLRTLLARAAGLDTTGVSRFALTNTALSVVTFAGPALNKSTSRLLRVNDAAHLEEIL